MVNQNRITPQQAAAMSCPNKCEPQMVVHALPRPGSGKNAVSRCMVCLLLWETTPKAEVVGKTQALSAPCISAPDGGYVLAKETT